MNTASGSHQQGTGDVGLVQPVTFACEQPLALQRGGELARFDLVFETYGKLNASASNAILICHALSGNHHAAGRHQPTDRKPGWWDVCIGPGKAIDTNRFFVVALNNLGGCDGSTGPLSVNPASGDVFGPDFPTVTVRDWVESQARLADHLGIHRFAAIIGGSLGGMQALQWAIDYPDRLDSAVLIASSARLTTQNIAFNKIARSAITSDAQFHNGRYAEHGVLPEQGLRVARMLGHITYLSDHALAERFGREIKSGNLDQGSDIEFQVESYLDYQGEAFSQRFDANTYLLMTKALDLFDPAAGYSGDLTAVFAQTRARFLMLSFSTDWRFSPQRSIEMCDAAISAGRDVSHAIIDSPHGHDSFLLPVPRYIDALSAYLNRLAEVSHA